MGCGCGKNQSSSPDSARASANLKKVSEKKLEPDPSLNQPTFPSIPQLSVDRRTRRNVKFTSNDKEESIPEEIETPDSPSIFNKVKNFGKSVASRVTQGKADEKLIKLRHISCHGDEEVVPCPYRSASNTREGAYFCTACGCGDKPRAFLNDPDDSGAYTKLDYPWVSCPVRMPGFGDYKPFSEETQEDIDKLPEGMKRKQLTEVVLTARGIDIPPAYDPVKTNGDTNDTNDSSES